MNPLHRSTRRRRAIRASCAVLGFLFLMGCVLGACSPRVRNAARARLQAALSVKEAPPEVKVAAPSAASVLRQRVLHAYPELTDPALSDWDKVCCIRAWAYSHVDLASAPLLVDKRKDLQYYRLSAPEVFALFDTDQGGVCCGGTAYALSKLFELFGFTAYVVNSGNPAAGATHCSTLVEIQHRGRKLFSIQDAYFNVGLVQAAREPLDYFDMLDLLRERRHEEIDLVTDSRAAPPELFFLYPEQIELCTQLERMWGLDPEDFTLDFLPDGRLRVRSHRDFARCEEMWGPKKAFPFLAKEGLPEKLAYLYLYPINIVRSDYVRASDIVAKAKSRAARERAGE